MTQNHRVAVVARAERSPAVAQNPEERIPQGERILDLAERNRVCLGIAELEFRQCDLPPINRAIGKLVKSDIKGVVGHEEAVYG